MGVKVKIMMDTEKAMGKYRKFMPDYVKIHEPKDDYQEVEPSAIPA